MKKNIFFMVLVLFGCVSTDPLLGSALVEETEIIKVDYHVRFERDESPQTLRMHLEIKHDEVVLVGFGMLGEVLFECKSRAQNVQCDKIAPAFPAERFFNVMQHMIWTAEEDERFTNVLSYENKHDGYRLDLQPLSFKRGKNE